MKDLICFRALGSPELTRGSRPLPLIRRPKRLAVFCFLALSRKSFRSRDIVQATFWPESDQERARHALNATLYLLRQELGTDVVVSRGTDEVGIAADGVWSDVGAFEDLVHAGDQPAALELYRGDLLPGFYISGAPDFERWLDEERARLRRVAADAACVHAQRTAERNPVDAAEWARRAVAMSQDDEIVVQRSIRVLDQVGNRSGALEIFDQFARRLRDEYGSEPAPETERLIVEVRSRVEPAPRLEPAPSRSSAPRGTRPPVVPLPSPPQRAEMPRRDFGPARQAGEPGWAVPSRASARIARPAAVVTIFAVCTGIAFWLAPRNGIGQAGGEAQSGPHAGIVVSRFQYLGTAPDLEYLSDAIATSLTEQLAEADAIDLIAEDTNAAAGWMDAGGRPNGGAVSPIFLVRGTVLPSHGRVRVSISLIDAAAGAILHTATVERPTGDVFKLIDEVAEELSRLLRTELGREIQLRRWRVSTRSTQAWELQKRAETARLRAKAFEEDGSFPAAASKLKEADSLLAAAQAADPTWLDPTVWRARVASDQVWLSFLPPISDSAGARSRLRMGMAYADRAIEKDSAHAVALEIRGTLHFWSALIGATSGAESVAAIRRAESDLRRAVTVDGTRAHAWSLLSAVLYTRGDFAESYVAAQHAYSADAYLETREETLVRLALTAYESGSDSIAWHWCAAVDARTAHGAYCRLALLAWSAAAPPAAMSDDPWAILRTASDSTPSAASMRAPLTMLVAAVLARREFTDSAHTVIERVRARDDQGQELDLLEAGARLALGERARAAALLRRYVQSDPARNEGAVRSRRFASLRELVSDTSDAHQ